MGGCVSVWEHPSLLASLWSQRKSYSCIIRGWILFVLVAWNADLGGNVKCLPLELVENMFRRRGGQGS